jgi:hypothetical protein
MNIENLESRWPDIAAKLRNRFTKLTEADVHYVKGFEEDLVTRIGKRLGKTNLAVMTLVDTL